MIKYLNEKEILLLKEIKENKPIPFSPELATLLVKKIVLEYDDGLEKQINPILLDNENFTNLI